MVLYLQRGHAIQYCRTLLEVTAYTLPHVSMCIYVYLCIYVCMYDVRHDIQIPCTRYVAINRLYLYHCASIGDFCYTHMHSS